MSSKKQGTLSRLGTILQGLKNADAAVQRVTEAGYRDGYAEGFVDGRREGRQDVLQLVPVSGLVDGELLRSQLLKRWGS